MLTSPTCLPLSKLTQKEARAVIRGYKQMILLPSRSQQCRRTQGSQFANPEVASWPSRHSTKSAISVCGQGVPTSSDGHLGGGVVRVGCHFKHVAKSAEDAGSGFLHKLPQKSRVVVWHVRNNDDRETSRTGF